MGRRNKGEERRIAQARVESLLAQARATALENPDRADRYATLAKRIGQRYQLRMPAAAKAEICKCGAYRSPERTRVRIQRNRINIHCQCGAIRRRPLEKS